jgi:biotin operon repressor
VSRLSLRTRNLLALFQENPEGFTLDELAKKVNANKKKDVLNSIHRLRLHKHNIQKIEDRYVYEKTAPYVSKSNPSDNPLIKELEQHPKGLSTPELAKALELAPNQIWNKVYYLKLSGYNIECTNHVYKLLPDSNKSRLATNKIDQPRPPKKPYTKNDDSLIPSQYYDTFQNLSESDKTDFIDMMRKSLYYRKSAIALLESNEEILSFLSSMKGQL